jgi:Zn-dependent protease
MVYASIEDCNVGFDKSDMMNLNEMIENILVFALPVIFAITLHESAHAYAARYFGDSTAYLLGRISLNPMKHIDPIGTLVLPVVLYIVSHGTFYFGYAKPVPIDFGKLRNPKKQMAWVALAGPGANFVMAFMWTVLAILLAVLQIKEPFFVGMADAGIQVNMLLFVFNLFPIPPLDGGRILTSILPHRYAYKFAQIEPYGFFIVMVLVTMHILDFWVAPMMYVTGRALQLLVFPLTSLLS